ncbi:MAG: lamin tail domain-containing protein, partial [Candidatus Kapaibacterium sp.]
MKFLFIAGSLLFFLGEALAQHVVINEIMYYPIYKSGEPQWIELFNPTDSAVPTIGWKISNHLHSYPVLADTIAPNGYLILTKDSVNFLRIKYSIPNANILQTTLPDLVHAGDDVVIKDSLGNIIDSVKYSSTWGGPTGISLDRIDYSAPSDSENFGSCIDSFGATPAALNSISRKDFDLAVVSLSDSIINNTDVSITATIQNKGRKEISDGTVSLFTNSNLPITQSQIVSPIAPLGKQV